MSFEKTLSDNDLHAIWAAMCAMTQDIHAPQDTLTDETVDAADALWTRLDAEINARHERAKALDVAIAAGQAVPLSMVRPGSIWLDSEADGVPGCRWPDDTPKPCVNEDGEDDDCSYGDQGPMWVGGEAQRVTVLISGLSIAVCKWVMSHVQSKVADVAADMARVLCVHLAAGGTPETFEETT